MDKNFCGSNNYNKKEGDVNYHLLFLGIYRHRLSKNNLTVFSCSLFVKFAYC